ncbi:MAG: adenylyl-sulfate kinase [Deltaproteobacteria bacterium]|nr:adenylyl-sulfate kinase [Deltaproteobacteria bacterium]
MSATTVQWQQAIITRADRERMNSHRGVTIWFTGLSGSGKSTLAAATEKVLFDFGHHTYTLDGDNIRHGLNKDLGFSFVDRVENIRRIAEVARLFRDAGIINMTAFISPHRKDRLAARAMAGVGTFIEVFVDCPIEVCEQRDPKGIYKKVRAGLITGFTGITCPYEPPESPEIHLRTDQMTILQSVNLIIDYLARHRLISLRLGRG